MIGGISNCATATSTNCYYLDSVAESAAGSGTLNGKASEKSDTAFASGEVAYLLNGDQSSIVWKQTIGTDDTPNFTGKTVNYGYRSCKDETAVYTNETVQDTKIEHSKIDGICSVCGGCDAPETGSGTEEDPYIIMNAGQLYWFAEQVNSGKRTICGKLGADITVNPGKFDEEGNYTDAPVIIGLKQNPTQTGAALVLFSLFTGIFENFRWCYAKQRRKTE